MKNHLILIGGGGHCRACIDVIELEGRYRIAGIIDIPERRGEEVLGYEIVGSDDMIASLAAEGYSFLITVGQIRSSQRRRELFGILRASGAKIVTIVSPRAYVSVHATVGEGSVIMHDVLVNANARIGENCIVNTKALIEHDAVVESHCHISTAAVVNGGAIVKTGTFFGSNATSGEGAATTEEGFVKAGALFLGGKQ